MPPKPVAKGLSFNQTAQAFSEFIEVAIHGILYVREIYPADLFMRRKKYDCPVYQSRHPALNEYISEAVKAMAYEMAKGTVAKFAVVIKDRDDEPLERFVFAVDNMIQVEPWDKNQTVDDAMTAGILAHYFRSFMIKLNMMESHLGQLSLGEELSFCLVMELKDKDIQPSPLGKPDKKGRQEPAPWMPAVSSHTTASAHENDETHMIRAVNTGVINLSLSVQESQKKLRRIKEMQDRKVRDEIEEEEERMRKEDEEEEDAQRMRPPEEQEDEKDREDAEHGFVV